MAIFKKTKPEAEAPVEAKAKTPRATKTKAPKEAATPVASGSAVGAAHRILVRPLLSEKTTRGESKNMYSFAVDMSATKTEIISAVQQVYGVKPTGVRTLVMEGKITRFGRSMGRRKNWKKAMVTLPKGTTIAIHTGV